MINIVLVCDRKQSIIIECYSSKFVHYTVLGINEFFLGANALKWDSSLLYLSTEHIDSYLLTWANIEEPLLRYM